MYACADQEQLMRFLGYELDRPGIEAISSHLAECERCRRRIEQMKAQNRTSDVSSPAQPCHDQVARVLAQVRARGPRTALLGARDDPQLGQNESRSSPEGCLDRVDEAMTGSPTGSQRYPQVDGFRIIREIGRGGMGVVYEAIEEKLSRRVALKILPGAARARRESGPPV